MTLLQQDLDTSARARTPGIAVPWPAVAVLATAVAGGIHLAAAATHRDSGELHIAFFLLTAFAQLGGAAALAVTLWAATRGGGRSLPALLLAAITGTVALLGLYVVVHSTDWLTGLIGQHGHAATSHVTGHPVETGAPQALGGTSGTPTETVDALGTANVVVELIAIAAYTALLPRSWRGRTTNALLAFGALAWIMWFTGGTV